MEHTNYNAMSNWMSSDNRSREVASQGEVYRAADRCFLEKAQAERLTVCLATGETNMNWQITRSVSCFEMREQSSSKELRDIGRAFAPTSERATAHSPTKYYEIIEA